MEREIPQTLPHGLQKWYDVYEKTSSPCTSPLSDLKILESKELATRYLDEEAAAYQLKRSKVQNSETAWLKTALSQGTRSDKIAAGIILVQDNPKYNLSRLISLISQVRSSKHGQCGTIMKSMKDLFLQYLLHPKFRLMKFEEQNLEKMENSPDNKKLLAHWYFEDQLLEQYQRFVESLAKIGNDTIELNRETAVAVMTDLLIGNVEQEHKLLELIVNKIGDPNSKVASKAIFCLNKALQAHPKMKTVIVKEVEKLLFRTNVAARAQYYAICLLTQIPLGKNEDELADILIDLYFAFFKACLKKGEPDSRMMAAILTGVNRAYPFANESTSKLNEHIDSIYKVVHVGSSNVSINALTLLYQVTGKDETQASRFYIAFYRKLLDPQIGFINRRGIFLNLLHKVLLRDDSVTRTYATIKRTLQVALYFPANMACASLYVVSKVLQRRKDLKKFLQRHRCTMDDIKIESADPTILTNVSISAVPSIEVVKLEESDKPYDPFCRNPSYSYAFNAFHFELLAMIGHYHPSVVVFAKSIILDKLIDYPGDLLEDLASIRFLDRYVFKNPKKLEEKKVKRANDPLAYRVGYSPKGIRSLPVNSQAYLNEREERIPVDELYLYRYLKMKNQTKGEIDIKKEQEDDIESVGSEEFDGMLDRLGDLENLDFAADIVPKRKKKNSEPEEEDEDEDEDELLSGEEFDDDSMDEEDISFDEDEEIDDKPAKKSKIKFDDDQLFVSAEKFSEMLEQQGRRKDKIGGTDEFSTIDKASSKQIDWEAKRNDKLRRGSYKRGKSNQGRNNNNKIPNKKMKNYN